MKLMKFLKLFVIIMPFMVIVDYLWLGVIAQNTLARELVSFEMTLRIVPAILVYLLMSVGIILFVLPKTNLEYKRALIWGAVFGLVLYGVYDLTNYAILVKWTFKFIVIDITWGIFINAFASVFAVYLSKLFGGK